MVAVDVERAYAAAGVALAVGAGELPDHVALELEFLSHLCAREAKAWEARRLEEAIGLLGAEREFLGRHLLPWFPALLCTVRDAAAPSSFYCEVVEATHAFLVHESDLVVLLGERDASRRAADVES
jgi:TorA maturation chaperone TorD